MNRDLDDLEAMVSATLAFGRDATLTEPAALIDLVALIGTVLDEAADAWPGLAEKAIDLVGPALLTVRARPVALKRALTNLVSNALNYGGSAHAVLLPPADGMVVLHIDDGGPTFRRASWNGCFCRSIGWRRAATAKPAASASACRSRATSCAPMVAMWCCSTGAVAGCGRA